MKQLRRMGTASAATAVGPDDFRSAMRQLASGLVVVTTWVEGRPWGMAVTACCSLSADPPTLLVSLQGRTRSRAAVLASGRFGINILGADQLEVAEQAARPGAPKYLDDHCVADADAAPRVRGALASLDCVLQRTVEVGDHTLAIGAVEAATAASHEQGAAPPLVYFDRSYRSLGRHL